MAFSLLPREEEYFDVFSQITKKIHEASDILVEMLADKSENYQAHAKRIKDLERASDALAHQITTKLNQSFITPFDREDIFSLVVALDDVCDLIDEGARAVVLYNIREVNDYAKEFAKVIQGAATEMNAAVSMLNKPAGMNQHVVEIHRLENVADDIYLRAIGDLFKNQTDPIMLIKWKELYEILEDATDRCETVANIIESIVLKHA